MAFAAAPPLSGGFGTEMCQVALGTNYAGMWSSDDNLAQELSEVGDIVFPPLCIPSPLSAYLFVSLFISLSLSVSVSPSLCLPLPLPKLACTTFRVQPCLRNLSCTALRAQPCLHNLTYATSLARPCLRNRTCTALLAQPYVLSLGCSTFASQLAWSVNHSHLYYPPYHGIAPNSCVIIYFIFLRCGGTGWYPGTPEGVSYCY